MNGLILSPSARGSAAGVCSGIDGSLLVEHNALGVCVANAGGEVLAINERGLEMFGVARTDYERLGMRWSDLSPDAADAETERFFAALERGDAPSTFERPFNRHDGTVAWALIGCTRLSRGLVLCFIIDITRKRASEEAAAYILDASGRIADSLDETHVLRQIGSLAVDRRFCDGTVLSRPGPDGRLRPCVLAWEDCSKMPDAAPMISPCPEASWDPYAVGRLVGKGPGKVVLETAPFCTLPQTGALTIRSYVTVPIPLPDRLYGTLSFYSTSRTFTEFDAQTAAEIGRRAGKQLEHAAAHQAATDHAQSLAKANADLQNFAAMVAHDLKSPLATITGYLQLVRLEMQEVSAIDPRLSRYMQRAEDLAKRALQAVDGMLNLAFMGPDVTAEGAVALDSTIAAALENLGLSWENARAKLDVGKLPNIYGSAPLFTLLWQNLLSNAVKYRSSEPLMITIKATRDGSWWHLEVGDNGVGFAPEVASGLFDIFTRLSDHRTLAGGHGIGLATCRKIVEAHGGRIWATPQTGHGAVFHILLPAAEKLLEGDTPVRVGASAGSQPAGRDAHDAR